MRHRLFVHSRAPVIGQYLLKGTGQIGGRIGLVHQREPDPVCRLTLGEPRQHAFGPDRSFHPPPLVAGFSGLLRRCRHCPRFVLRRSLPSRIHFPASLRSTVVTRFFATMDALTPAGRFFGPWGHERRLSPTGLPDFALGLPTILSPTIGVTTGDRPAARRFAPYRPLCRLRLSLEDSPIHTDRIEFTAAVPCGQPVLRTGRSRSVALHPALLRRSYGSIPHDSSPHRSGLPPLYPTALSGARVRPSRAQQRRCADFSLVWPLQAACRRRPAR